MNKTEIKAASSQLPSQTSSAAKTSIYPPLFKSPLIKCWPEILVEIPARLALLPGGVFVAPGDPVTHEEAKTNHLSMTPSEEDVRSLMADYERDFNVALEYEDAERMLVLYGELCDLFEEYLGDVIDRDELVPPYPLLHLRP